MPTFGAEQERINPETGRPVNYHDFRRLEEYYEAAHPEFRPVDPGRLILGLSEMQHNKNVTLRYFDLLRTLDKGDLAKLLKNPGTFLGLTPTGDPIMIPSDLLPVAISDGEPDHPLHDAPARYRTAIGSIGENGQPFHAFSPRTPGDGVRVGGSSLVQSALTGSEGAVEALLTSNKEVVRAMMEANGHLVDTLQNGMFMLMYYLLTRESYEPPVRIASHGPSIIVAGRDNSLAVGEFMTGRDVQGDQGAILAALRDAGARVSVSTDLRARGNGDGDMRKGFGSRSWLDGARDVVPIVTAHTIFNRHPGWMAEHTPVAGAADDFREAAEQMNDQLNGEIPDNVVFAPTERGIEPVFVPR